LNRLRLALFARRVLDAYLEIYHATEGSGADSGMPPYDTASTVSGQYELSGTGNGSTFGFGPPPRRVLRLRDIDVGGHDGEAEG
jgi:hypothetical protein